MILCLVPALHDGHQSNTRNAGLVLRLKPSTLQFHCLIHKLCAIIQQYGCTPSLTPHTLCQYKYHKTLVQSYAQGPVIRPVAYMSSVAQTMQRVQQRIKPQVQSYTQYLSSVPTLCNISNSVWSTLLHEGTLLTKGQSEVCTHTLQLQQLSLVYSTA